MAESCSKRKLYYEYLQVVLEIKRKKEIIQMTFICNCFMSDNNFKKLKY